MTEYDKLVNKVNNIDTTGFVLNTKYDNDIISGFLLASIFSSKITELENKIPDVENLASKT